MAFNIHVSRIIDNPTVTETAAHNESAKNTRTPQPKVYKTPSLVNVPAGNVIPKYRVQIFEVQAEA
jgi:hypothetical protein